MADAGIPETSRSRLAPILVLLIPILAIYFFTTRTAILDDGDALYAHVAQQMVERGDWVTPYANGVRFLDKPPMMYWLMAGSYELFGMNELAARLASVLAVAGTALLLYWMGFKAGGASTGSTAAIAVAFCVGTFLFTRMVFPDILFVFFLTLALAAFLAWCLDPGSSCAPVMLFYAALAGAVLTKGLIGIVFPLAIVVVFLLWSRELRRLRTFHLRTGALLFLALAVPWHVVAALRNPGFLSYYFVNEQILRFLGRRQPVDYESISLPVFWALALVWLFPWCAFLPAARHLVRPSRIEDPGTRVVVRLALVWAAVIAVFFTFSSRIEHYVLPLLPALALLIAVTLARGRILDAAADERRRRSVARSFAFLALAGSLLALAGAAGGTLWLRGQAPGASASHTLEAYRHYFAPLFALPQAMLSRFAAPLAGTLTALLLGTSAAWWAHRRGSTPRAVAALAAMMAAFFVFASHSLGLCEEILSSKQFAGAVSALHRPGDSVVVVGDFETANSINFYARVPIEIFGGRAAVLEWGLAHSDAPRRILSRQQLETRWKGAERTFVLAPEASFGSLALEGGSTLVRSGGRVLAINRTGDGVTP